MKKPSSKNPISRKQKNKKIAGKKQQTTLQKHQAFPQPLGKIVYSLIAFALSSLSLFTIYPRISVVPGTSLDLHSPFKTPFVIKNDGYLSIYDIKYSLIAENMELINGTTFTNSGGSLGNTIEELSPNKSSALFVDRIFSIPPNLVKNARIFISVSYRPSWIPFSFSEDIHFKTEINTNHEYVWYESYEKRK